MNNSVRMYATDDGSYLRIKLNELQVEQVKAISLWQPWASAISFGLKHYETRGWKTNYRGKLVICSARKNSKQQRQTYKEIKNKLAIETNWNDLPRGYAIAICDLTDCTFMTDDFIRTIKDVERECGDWQVGRYAWKLENIYIPKKPIPVTGKQGLWNFDL